MAVRPAGASAQPAPAGRTAGAPGDLIDQRIAVWRFDALGLEPEIVQRLETLFRMEVARLARQPQPARRDVERAVTRAEQGCTGQEACLSAIGRRLGVELVVTGTAGSLGDTYVLEIQAVDVATATSRRIQSDPLRGSPDELIEGVRVAAYRLLAPNQIHGALQIQTDLVGAEVSLDGKAVGRTPLPRGGVLSMLAPGTHRLSVTAPGYERFDSDVVVRFQKVSPVVVRLVQSGLPEPTTRVVVRERAPLYTRPWFIGAVGASAVVLAVLIGRRQGRAECVMWSAGAPSPCE